MISFQEEFRVYLKENNINATDNTGDTTLPDFTLTSKELSFYVELKEKNRYNMRNWPDTILEKYLFICDDLSFRKLLKHAPYSCLLIRDNSRNRIHIFFIVDLFYIKKQRVNRRVDVKKNSFNKGKCLIDLRSSTECYSLTMALDCIQGYIINKDKIYKDQASCYGAYPEEEIGVGGVIRDDEYIKNDLERYNT